jgi:hypothetical protein
MKINAKFGLPLIVARQANYDGAKKYLLGKMNENHFIALILTLWASRRLPSAALFRAKHPALAG